ncbi:MAG: glycosyltransferase family 4 protein [Caulobacter sp.]|nr:glycosyltransferase family 4 protein [Caulobacter sp.]
MLSLLPSARQLRRVVLIGSFPPRRCGIATFTADVHQALRTASPNLHCGIVAMTDEGGAYDYGEEVIFQVRQNRAADYLEAARRINLAAPDAVCVQHEFGLFGGPAGENLMLMLDAIRAPVTATLHTVLAQPDADQRRVLNRLIKRSARIIVMAERGREILRDVWKVPASKIVVVPHGAPDRPLVDTAGPKAALGLTGRDVLLTFGLLSPGKGLETVIRAMPDIVRARPDALYVILGATHPHLIAREGEAYRESLFALARQLGVADHVRFHNQYVDMPLLLDWLSAADLYVTPYLNEAQITSGTLTYAVALGKAVISTPYWHAQELLADGRGVLTPFNNPQALASAAVTLLADPERLDALRRRAWDMGRETLWSRLADRYLDVFAAVRETRPRPSESRSVAPGALPRPALGGVRRMTDGVGMLQHSVHDTPDRNHGYCVDDNARALLLMHRLRAAGMRTPETEALAGTYAAFVHHAWNDGVGRFRNFMAYDRSWLEDVGSDDSVARSWWAVAVTAAEGGSPALRKWARALAVRVAPHMDSFTALRTYAFLILGLTSLVRADPGLTQERALLERLTSALAEVLRGSETGDWHWFEDSLTYDNARLPEALLRAGQLLDDEALITAGLSSLDWLCRQQTGVGGVFRAVGTVNFGRPFTVEDPFDQQPLEAAATVDACAAAFAATGDPRWLTEARRAFDWFLGKNDLGVPLGDPATGDCYDGLTPTGPNLNRGAESVLSFQLAACAMLALARIAQPGPRPADKVQTEGRTADRCQNSVTTTSESLPIPRASSFGPSTSLQIPGR